MQAQDLQRRLAAYLETQFDVEVVVKTARPLAGGASRDSWALDLRLGDQDFTWVMRRDLPTQMFDESLNRAQEYALMDTAYRSGVLVAPVRHLCTDPSVLDGAFFLMDYIHAISIGPKVMQAPELAQARQRLPEQMAEQLAKIHAIDASNLEFLPRPQPGQTPAQAVIAQCYAILDALKVQNPVWEWTLRWAIRHAPTPVTQTFVHGDFRIGNLLIDESGLRAVIDWEFGHIGDPDEELGYVCMRDWRFGNGHLRCAGLCDRERFLRAYELASGRTVDRTSVTWWEVMGNIRWGIICMSQANRHLSGAEQSVELASLGRRSAEMQLEALRLIEAS
ncbi:MAG: phosphotransferase family protein [Anaerolineae bacterium]|nr:phosphotransferase family protein [Anaerolineae bacterium]